MLSRRLLRIKAVKALYSHFKSESDSLIVSEKNLMLSIDKTYELYHQMLWLVVEVANYAENRIELGRRKHLPTPEELNPNTKFVDNRVVAALRESDALTDYLQRKKLGWVQAPELVKKLYHAMVESDYYRKYMDAPARSFKEDVRLVESFYTRTVGESEALEEALEVTRIHSAAGTLAADAGVMAERPFRAPHHTVSAVALSGGGSFPRPGEISLSHNGVLFLDELPEFHKDVLEALRQPLEDGEVTITRASGTLRLPSRFMLVCAMNPCRCGWRGHPSGRCTCSAREVERYVEKISGPLLDRIDLHVSVPAVEYASMRRKETPESSADVKCRVDAARAVQTARFAGTGVTCNAHMTAPMIGQFCCLDHAGDALMKSAFERMGLTARSHDRILRVARTIADLDGAADIRPEHLAEAIQFRNTDILKG